MPESIGNCNAVAEVCRIALPLALSPVSNLMAFIGIRARGRTKPRVDGRETSRLYDAALFPIGARWV